MILREQEGGGGVLKYCQDVWGFTEQLKRRRDKIRKEYMQREVKHVMFLQATTHKDAVRE